MKAVDRRKRITSLKGQLIWVFQTFSKIMKLVLIVVYTNNRTLWDIVAEVYHQFVQKGIDLSRGIREMWVRLPRRPIFEI